MIGVEFHQSFVQQGIIIFQAEKLQNLNNNHHNTQK